MNSAPNGVNSGTVSVEWKLADHGRAIIWREAGGPVVEIPTRQDFGTANIENSIPYDLGGTASVEYNAAGFEAHLTVPSNFLGDTLPDAAVQIMPPCTSCRHQYSRRPDGSPVEDSMIIALVGEDSLRSLGVNIVHIASSVERPVTIIMSHEIHLAILDYNLGDETSIITAELLLQRGMAVAFATGYGDGLDVAARLERSYRPQALRRRCVRHAIDVTVEVAR